MRGDGNPAYVHIAPIRVSIHAPRMRGDVDYAMMLDAMAHVSIHAPRMRGDFEPMPSRITQYMFQSTPLA